MILPKKQAKEVNREEMGKMVREAWLAYCRETDQPVNHKHSATWEELTEWEKEVDRRIGESLFSWGAGAAREKFAGICKEIQEVASWSDQTDYYRGRGDAASDCGLEIQEAEW